jgi:hypothetical protein
MEIGNVVTIFQVMEIRDCNEFAFLGKKMENRKFEQFFNKNQHFKENKNNPKMPGTYTTGTNPNNSGV